MLQQQCLGLFYGFVAVLLVVIVVTIQCVSVCVFLFIYLMAILLLCFPIASDFFSHWRCTHFSKETQDRYGEFPWSTLLFLLCEVV